MITTEYLTKFKEEILGKLQENEVNVFSLQNAIKHDVDGKLKSFEKRCDEFSLRVSDVQNITISQRGRIEKISELQKFQENTNEALVTHDVVINNLETDLKKACAKYDKHYLDNLIVPGTIGDFCKYKNLKEYIEVISLHFYHYSS